MLFITGTHKRIFSEFTGNMIWTPLPTPYTPVELTKAFLVEAVPDVNKSIGATRRERVEAPMEGNGIDWEDLLRIVLLDAMTLECIFLLLHLRTRVHVLDGDTGCHIKFNIQRQTSQYVSSAVLIQQMLHLTIYFSDAASRASKHHITYHCVIIMALIIAFSVCCDLIIWLPR